MKLTYTVLSIERYTSTVTSSDHSFALKLWSNALMICQRIENIFDLERLPSTEVLSENNSKLGNSRSS